VWTSSGRESGLGSRYIPAERGAIVEQNEILDGLRQAVIDGQREVVERWANEAIQKGLDPLLAIEEGLRKGLDVVGGSFRRGEFFLPELLMAAEAAKAASAILEKELERTGAQTPASRVMVIGTVAGDIHDIGKTLVAVLFKVAGFSVIDLGVNVPAERFVEAVKEYKPDILGLSSLLTTTAKGQKVVIDGLEEAGVRRQVKVMVGGGAITRDWADEIGADGYGEDAADAVETGKKLVGLL